MNIGKIIKLSKKIFPEISMNFVNMINATNNIDYTFMDYIEDVKFLDENSLLKDYMNLNNLNMQLIVQSKKNLKEISIKLNSLCGLTHKEIANKFGVSRIKITRLLNE